MKKLIRIILVLTILLGVNFSCKNSSNETTFEVNGNWKLLNSNLEVTSVSNGDEIDYNSEIVGGSAVVSSRDIQLKIATSNKEYKDIFIELEYDINTGIGSAVRITNIVYNSKRVSNNALGYVKVSENNIDIVFENVYIEENNYNFISISRRITMYKVK